MGKKVDNEANDSFTIDMEEIGAIEEIQNRPVMDFAPKQGKVKVADRGHDAD